MKKEAAWIQNQQFENDILCILKKSFTVTKTELA